MTDNKDEKWIYESPDNGKTVYRRRFNDYDNRELIKKDGEWKEGANPNDRIK